MGGGKAGKGKGGKGKGGKGKGGKGGRGSAVGGQALEGEEEFRQPDSNAGDGDDDSEDDVEDAADGEVKKKKKKGGGFQSMELSYPVYSGIMKMGYKVSASSRHPTASLPPSQRKHSPVS